MDSISLTSLTQGRKVKAPPSSKRMSPSFEHTDSSGYCYRQWSLDGIGSIWHVKSTEAINEQPGGPNDLFNSFQIGGDEDIQAIYEGMDFGIRAFKNLVPLDGSFDRVWPPANLTSEADLKQFARDEAWGHHASCTCPIGRDDDPTAVLDKDFLVRGTENLRVVDASVFNKIPGTYLALPVYMIGEKAADVILQSATGAAPASASAAASASVNPSASVVAKPSASATSKSGGLLGGLLGL